LPDHPHGPEDLEAHISHMREIAEGFDYDELLDRYR
jgi:hypothetical protein